jgi:gas vesicle protein
LGVKQATSPHYVANDEGEDGMSEYLLEDGHNGSHSAGFLTGLLLGGLVSAGAVLLFAPHSGEETRASIRREGVHLRDRTAQTVDGTVAQVRDRVHEITSGVREKAEELQQDGQDMLYGQKERASTAVKAARDAIQGS